MYKFIQISLTSDDVVYHEERKNYLRSLWGNHFEHKKGFIAKFSGAIGFTPVMFDCCSNYPYFNSFIRKHKKNISNSIVPIYFDTINTHYCNRIQF